MEYITAASRAKCEAAVMRASTSKSWTQVLWWKSVDFRLEMRPGFSLRDRIKNLDIRRKLVVEPLLLYIERVS